MAFGLDIIFLCSHTITSSPGVGQSKDVAYGSMGLLALMGGSVLRVQEKSQPHRGISRGWVQLSDLTTLRSPWQSAKVG